MEEKVVTKEEVWANFDRLEKMLAKNAEENRIGFEKLRLSGIDLDKRIKAVTEQMGGMCNSEGASAEELFATSLAKKMTFAGQHYDSIEYNLKKKTGDTQDEFDVVLSNGSSVAVIEVKYRACQADVIQLTTKKVANFRTLYPHYKDYTVYLGIGSMSFDARVIEKAKELGVGLLRQQGDSIETESGYVRAY